MLQTVMRERYSNKLYYATFEDTTCFFAASLSEIAFQTTVKMIALRALAASLEDRPRNNNPVKPSLSIILLAASKYPIGSSDVCLYVFSTRTAFEHTSDTRDDARPVSARRTFFLMEFCVFKCASNILFRTQ